MPLFPFLLLFVAIFTLIGNLYFDLAIHLYLHNHFIGLRYYATYYTYIGDSLPWIIFSLLAYLIARYLVHNTGYQHRFSFLFLSKHYLTDVVAGAFVSIYFISGPTI